MPVVRSGVPAGDSVVEFGGEERVSYDHGKSIALVTSARSHLACQCQKG